MRTLISTVNVKLDWNAYLQTLAPRGRLHFVGATLEPLDLGVFNLITGQRSVSGLPVGSPAAIATMLDFAVRHDIRPVVEVFHFPRSTRPSIRCETARRDIAWCLKGSDPVHDDAGYNGGLSNRVRCD